MTGRTKPTLLLLAAILCLPAAMFAVDVTGVVQLREGNRTTPFSRVTVIAQAAGGGEVYASAKTDADGAFALTNLPSPRMQLTARRAGFYVQSAGGHEDRQIVLDCSIAADCTGVAFEMRKGAVITGRVVDEIGEPLQEVRVSAREPEAGEQNRRGGGVGAQSDDRGIFRLAGLEPGAYVLTADRRRRGPRGAEAKSAEMEVQVGEGEILGGVELMIEESSSDAETFSVSGKIVGVDYSERSMVFVIPRNRRRNHGAPVEADGSFKLGNLPEGDYEARYMVGFQPGRRGPGQRIRLSRFSVDRDQTDLVLRPVAPTGMRGRLIIESGEPNQMIMVRFLDQDENWAMGTTAEGPEYEFESQDFEPGEYRPIVGVGFRRNDSLFIKEVRVGGEPIEDKTIRLSEGVMEDVEFVLSDEFGKVSGRVKAPNDGTGLRKGAQYTVALKGPQRVRSVQADQLGRFAFDDIPPGDYKICAWENISRNRIHDTMTWEEAGAAAREFPVDAGSEIEIDLTAVQP